MYTCNYCIFQFVRIESKYFGRRIKSSKAERLKETGRGEADVPPRVKSVFLLPGPGSPAPMLPAGTSSGPIPPLSAGGDPRGPAPAPAHQERRLCAGQCSWHEGRGSGLPASRKGRRLHGGLSFGSPRARHLQGSPRWRRRPSRRCTHVPINLTTLRRPYHCYFCVQIRRQARRDQGLVKNHKSCGINHL